MTQECGVTHVEEGREPVVGAYAFFRRYGLLPWQSCLDVGGGMGVGLSMLRERSGKARAIDVDPQLAVLGVETGRIEDQPDESVDWVLAVDVIEHIHDDVAFLREMWRVARKGVYLTTPNRAHHPDRNWPYHIREYTEQEFETICLRGIPSGARLFFGGDTYCGNMRMNHWTSDWEHQAVICFKRGGRMTMGLFKLRELLMSLMGRQ